MFVMALVLVLKILDHLLKLLNLSSKIPNQILIAFIGGTDRLQCQLERLNHVSLAVNRFLLRLYPVNVLLAFHIRQ